MNRKTTAWLATLALALGAFILLVERPGRRARAAAAQPQPVLGGLDPAAVSAVAVRWSNVLIEAVRADGGWRLVQPVEHPAHRIRIGSLLERLAALRGRSLLTPAELRARPEAAADFGLAPAQAAVVLRTGAGETEIRFGLPVYSGGAVHLQVLGRAGIFTAESSLFDALPRHADDWRDPRLAPLRELSFDRLRAASSAGAWTLGRSGTNGGWQILEPRPARADTAQVEALLRALEAAPVGRFLADVPPAALEPFGLRPPAATVTLGQGTNTLWVLELGGPVPNAADFVHARRSAPPGLVTAPAALLEALRVPYTALLDRRLFDFPPAAVAAVQVGGTHAFRLARDAPGGWLLTEGTNRLAADAELAAEFLARLTSLGIAEVAKEVVTDLDLDRFGLAPPRRSFSLFPAGSTNALARLDLGGPHADRVHVRRAGEPPVYEILAAELAEVDLAAWQLRDRTLWSFAGTNVVSVLVQKGEHTWSLTRQGANHWELPPVYRNEVNPFALDEALHRLGGARVLGWVARDDAADRFGLRTGIQLTFEFRPAGGVRPAPLLLDFGKRSPRGHFYARLGGTPGPVFELPGPLVDALWAQLRLPGEPSSPP